MITHYTHTPLLLIDATDQIPEKQSQSCLLHPAGLWPEPTPSFSVGACASVSVFLYANLYTCIHMACSETFLNKPEVTIFKKAFDTLTFVCRSLHDWWSVDVIKLCFQDTQYYLYSSRITLRSSSPWLLQCLLDFQERQLVRVANTNDQITLSELGLHCRQKTNILFHICLGSTLSWDVQKQLLRIYEFPHRWSDLTANSLNSKLKSKHSFLFSCYFKAILVFYCITDTKIPNTKHYVFKL